MDDEEYSLDLGDKKGHFHERVAEWGQNKKNKNWHQQKSDRIVFFFWLFETVP